MLRLLKYLLTGDLHLHEWEIIRENKHSYDTGISNGTCTKFTQQCKKCGKLKIFYNK